MLYYDINITAEVLQLAVKLKVFLANKFFI